MTMMAPADMKITMSDTRLAGHCVRGVKTWFEAYDLDFKDFLINGISAEAFLATQDARAIRIVQLKLEREANG